MTLTEALVSALLGVLTIVFGALGPVVFDLVRKVAGEKVAAVLQAGVDMAVQAVEQTNKDAASGTKKAMAVRIAQTYLDSKKIAVNETTLADAVEAAVLRMNRTIPGPMELVELAAPLQQVVATSGPAPVSVAGDVGLTTP